MVLVWNELRWRTSLEKVRTDDAEFASVTNSRREPILTEIIGDSGDDRNYNFDKNSRPKNVDHTGGIVVQLESRHYGLQRVRHDGDVEPQIVERQLTPRCSLIRSLKVTRAMTHRIPMAQLN